MAAIHICDIHKAEKGELVETTRYRKVRGRPDLRLDVCKECNETRFPKSHTIVDYVKLVYKCRGITLTDEQAKEYSKRVY